MEKHTVRMLKGETMKTHDKLEMCRKTLRYIRNLTILANNKHDNMSPELVFKEIQDRIDKLMIKVEAKPHSTVSRDVDMEIISKNKKLKG